MSIPRPEPPNPQFERKEWLNLNGIWEFQLDMGKSGIERKMYELDHLEGQIVVPFCVESTLSGVQNLDFMPSVWYRRTFSVPENWNGGRVILHFGAADYETFVYINKQLAGSHKGGYSSFEMDITSLLKAGDNSLIVCAQDDIRSCTQPRGKQSSLYHSSGCDYTRCTGIWQTVWLEHLPDSHLKSFRFYPDVENQSVGIEAELTGNEILSVEVSYKGKTVGQAQVQGEPVVHLTVPLTEKHLWEAGCGRLYDVKFIYGKDQVQSYFGLRSVRLDGLKFLLNGKSIFLRMVLDQGYYRDGIYTAKDDETLKRDIQLSMDMGFNGARLHQKVFEPRFLYHCDRAGYLVWGEFPSWGFTVFDQNALVSLLPEWLEVLKRDCNHPSIIGWCPLNEIWRQTPEFQPIVYQATKAYDPARPCIDVSGYTHVMKSEIFDVHDYDPDPKHFRETYRRLSEEGVWEDRFGYQYQGQPIFVSEYGGIRWDLDSDLPEGSWGYGESPETEKEFLERYRGLTDALLENDHVMGFCYTQLYDIEQEVNGLYTYDRKPKFDPGVIRAINSKKSPIEE